MPIDNSLRMDEEGVSEVVGTILVLMMTVVLFTSIFAAVTTLDSPEEREHAEFYAEYEVVGESAFINITHRGGETFEMDELQFFIFDDEAQVIIEDDEISLEGEGEIDGKTWSSEETVEIHTDEDMVVEALEVELMIRNTETNRIVWQTDLEVIEDEALSIRDTEIEYRFEWREYAEPGEEVLIRASVATDQAIDIEDDIEVRAKAVLGGVFEEEEEGEVELEYEGRNVFEKTVTIATQDEDRYNIKVTASYEGDEEEYEGEKAEDFMILNVGEETATLYQRDLVVGDVYYSPEAPTHGDDLTITANIYNNWRENITANWRVRDDGEEVDNGTATYAHGQTPTEITAEFDVEGHGPHDIEVYVNSTELHDGNEIGDDPVGDVNPENNLWEEVLHVDPHIKLVQDSLDGDLLEAPRMMNALRGLNLDFDTMRIDSEHDIPEKEEFRDDLNESSVVIWMSGEEGIHIGEGAAQEALAEFIEPNNEDNGTLWLIGSSLDEESFGPDLEEILPVDHTDFDPLGDSGGIELISGHENGTYGEYSYNATLQENDLEITDSEADEDNELLGYSEELGVEDKVFGAGYDTGEGERTAVNSFLFENIEDSGQRINMASEVINWLTMMETRSGVDVAVASQYIEPTAPMFMDTIEVSATLRNNGPEDLYVTVRAERNGGEEVLEPEEDGAIYLPKEGGINTATFEWTADELGMQEFIVIADYYHEIDQVTRENNDITYKDLDATDDMTEVNVHYSTLVVDADGSVDDDYHNVTAELIESYERLGHIESGEVEDDDVEAFPQIYEYYPVEDPQEVDETPDLSYLREFNAVIWITGEREDEVFAHEEDESDMANLWRYSAEAAQVGGVNLMLIGEHIVDFLEEHEEDNENDDDIADLLLGQMGVEREGEVDELGEMIGQEDNPLSHGLRYRYDGSEGATTLNTNDADVLFEDGEGNPVASINDDEDGRRKVAYLGLNLSRIEGPLVEQNKFADWPGGEVELEQENALDQFVHTTMWQFGVRDDRAELRVVDHDVRIVGDEEPHTGRSYEIMAEIQNVGYRGTSALVRIKDGEDYIGSDTIHVEGSRRDSEEGTSYFTVDPGTTPLEVTWRPSYAGTRDLRVRVDPLRRAREISEAEGIDDDDEQLDPDECDEEKLMEFQNQATMDQPVYYFWDDMEQGDDEWSHDATKINIDGAGPLDFMDEKEADTDVAGDWDPDMTTEEVEEVKDEYKSHPSSFFIEEDGDVEANALVSIVIDNSFSMGDRMYQEETWLWHAKEAAEFLVDGLSDESMVGLWNYDGTNPNRITEPLRLEDHRDDIIDYIDGIDSNPQAPVWDSVGGAYTDVDDLRDEHPELFPAVVGLTDGADKHASDVAANPDDFETGSEEWAPWHKMEDGEINYDDSHMGKYRFDYRDDPDPFEPGEWEAVPPHDAHDPGERKGLLNSTFPIFTIGMGVEHNPDVEENPDDPDWNPAPDLGSAGDDNYLIEADLDDKRTWEAGTMEYNLWCIANTSDAEYFYAPDPGDLDDIFDEIADLITEPGELRSIDDPITPSENDEGSLTQDDPTDWDQKAVTPSIDLSQATSAELSFWHRFDLLEGINGAYLQLGFPDEYGDYKWYYVEPNEGSYNGNLYLQDNMPEDHFGNDVMWAWNQKSAHGTLDWQYSRLDVMEKIEDAMENDAWDELPDDTLEDVKIGFFYTHYGFPPDHGGWWIDDVTVTASSEWDAEGPSYWNLTSASQLDEMGIEPGDDIDDYYDHTYGDGDGHYWMFTTVDNDNDNEDKLPQGVDSSLYTSTISLSNAVEPELNAHLKFNLDPNDNNAPPDGFRIELSDDGGRTWDSLSTGNRTGWGASGHEDYDDDYAGTREDDEYGWVNSETLRRFNTDLSAWRGDDIILRFRVATNNQESYAEEDLPEAIFIDDVMVQERAFVGDPTSYQEGESSLEDESSTVSSLSDEATDFELDTTLESDQEYFIEEDLGQEKVILSGARIYNNIPEVTYRTRFEMIDIESQSFIGKEEVL